MISGISSWAGGIVTAVMIVTILEMMLPEGKNKKYIKTVLGIYLLFTIISPIIKAVNNEEINFENLMEMENIMNSTNSVNKISIETNASIENMYETNLKKDIKSKLEQKGYKASQIAVVFELEDEQNYGKIYEISLQLEKEKEKDEKNSNGTIHKIEKIQITVGNEKEEQSESSEKESITEKEKQEIKEYLSTNYDVEKNKITIS